MRQVVTIAVCLASAAAVAFGTVTFGDALLRDPPPEVPTVQVDAPTTTTTPTTTPTTTTTTPPPAAPAPGTGPVAPAPGIPPLAPPVAPPDDAPVTTAPDTGDDDLDDGDMGSG